MNFKVGDKVRILDGSKISDYSGKFIDSMSHYVGEIRTISEVIPKMYHYNNNTSYGLKGIPFVWDERGLELVESETDTHDKFDWEAFKRGDVTVTFKTNESQKQFLKRCETHGLKWSSGENPTTRSYINLEALEIGDGGLYYRYAVDSTPTVYDWDARKYIKRSEKPNTDWTEEEITEAKFISHALLCKIFDDGDSIKFTVIKEHPNIVLASFYRDNFRSFKAKAKHGDKPNEWVGKCVCLCKATQTPIPSFILDKNKERK